LALSTPYPASRADGTHRSTAADPPQPRRNESRIRWPDGGAAAGASASWEVAGVKHMRLINDADERLFQTVTVAARIGRAERLLPTLLADYDDRWDEPEAGFRYALALIALIQAAGSDREKRARYTQSMEALDDVTLLLLWLVTPPLAYRLSRPARRLPDVSMT
jgi:hypothetical protein